MTDLTKKLRDVYPNFDVTSQTDFIGGISEFKSQATVQIFEFNSDKVVEITKHPARNVRVIRASAYNEKAEVAEEAALKKALTLLGL